MRIPSEVSVDPEIELWKNDHGFYLKARLNVSLPGIDRELAQSLVEGAHQTCPYSKATRGNIDVGLKLADTGNAQTWGTAD